MTSWHMRCHIYICLLKQGITKVIDQYTKESKSALQAISDAQRLAFAPMFFMATVCIRDFGILSALDNAKDGLSCEQLVSKCSLNDYAVQLLLDVGLSSGVIYVKEDKYYLSKVGFFILHDKMTRVNMDFTLNVCYQGLAYLKDSLLSGKPEGLKVFSDAATIYPVLSTMPQPAKDSWFAFDHFYSDTSSSFMLSKVFSYNIRKLADLGGNTGKWALSCLKHDAEVQMTIVDLPEQIVLCKQNIANEGMLDRVSFVATDILKGSELPADQNWWLSQFLDCFSKEQILFILNKISTAMSDDNFLFIQELFWDRQRFEAAACSLNASSLYFTTMANGYSRFYSYEVFVDLINKAGFGIVDVYDHQTTGHTLLVLKKNHSASNVAKQS